MYQPNFINGELKAHRDLVTCTPVTPLNEQQAEEIGEAAHNGIFCSSDPFSDLGASSSEISELLGTVLGSETEAWIP